eukprot:177428_1
MTDSSYDEDDHSADDEAQHPQHSKHSQHTHSQSAFTQRFGGIKKQLPSAFKKNTSRERMSTAEEDVFNHDKSSSFGSMLKSRFQPSFVNRIRSQSEVNVNGSPSPGHYSHHSHSHSQSQSSISPKSMPRDHPPQRPRRHSVKKNKKNPHHSHRKKKKHDDSALLNENRALKNEIEVYKRSLDAVSAEKDHLEKNYDELKSKVSDVTTQLRIMTKRYNKLKSKNEEYKKHFQNTLTIRLSAQQQTITNYHAQLTQIKDKYDILYSEYLDKNNIIKDWEAKYHRLAADFDEFMQGQQDAGNGDTGTPSQLVAHTKQLKRIIIEKDQSLGFLSQIILNMYHNALPIIQQISHEDEEEEDDDRKTVSTDSNSSRSINQERHRHHRQHDEEEEDEEDDEDDELSSLEEEEAIARHAANNSNAVMASKLNLSKLQIPRSDLLNDRSLSGISVDDDGVDERPDDNGTVQSAGIANMNPIQLPKLKSAPPIGTTSSSLPIKKKRRRSWVMEGGGSGPIVITTIDGDVNHDLTNQTK